MADPDPRLHLPADNPWPLLGVDRWQDTRDTLHLWTQVVGKVRMALEPMVNHWWHVTLYVSASGLTTSLMHAGGRGLEIEFDFLEHDLVLQMTDGGSRRIALEPRSVASFYRATMQALDDLGVPLTIVRQPNEVADAIPFDQDEVHRSYDAHAVHQFWLALVQTHRVLARFLYLNPGHNADVDVVDRAIAVENKWRAQRYGVQGTFVTRSGAITVGDLLDRVLEVTTAETDAFACREHLEQCRAIVLEGTSADAQLRVFTENQRDGQEVALHRVTRWIRDATLLA